MKWEMRRSNPPVAEMTQTVKEWVAHTPHAHSVGLRRVVLSSENGAVRVTGPVSFQTRLPRWLRVRISLRGLGWEHPKRIPRASLTVPGELRD